MFTGILIWIGGNATLIIGGIIAIVIVAICKGFVFYTKPEVEYTSTKDGITVHHYKAGQRYVMGPSQHRPTTKAMGNVGAKIVEHLSGMEEYRLPQLEDIVDAEVARE